MLKMNRAAVNRLEGNEFDTAELPPNTDPRWQLWGPYMSNREWGTVRETGGLQGSNWTELPYERAASTMYRYCEDGIFGVCDRDCRVCHSYAFWNYRDDHLKERFYGLNNAQGAHGEDAKEVYSFKAADPQYRYISADFLYPQTEYPYRHLSRMETPKGAAEVSAMSAVRSAAVSLPELNNWHWEQRYFELEFEMCKLTPERLYLQLSVTNCSAESARLVAMPMLFLRNTWSPGQTGDHYHVEKIIKVKDNCLIVCFKDADNREFHLGYYFDTEVATPEILLTENVTSSFSADTQLTHSPSKDAFHRYIIRGDSSGLLANLGNLPASKAGICYRLNLAPKQQIKLRCFLMSQRSGESATLNWKGLTSSMEMVRLQNNVDTYQSLPACLIPAEQDIVNAAYTNLLWNRQYYPLDRMPHLWRVFSSGAGHLPSRLVTVPDKWEQPYLASWDTALHCLCLSCFDRRQAMEELLLLLALVRSDGSMYADEYRPEGVTPPLVVLAAVDLYSKCSQDEQHSVAPLIYDRLNRHLNWWLQRRDACGVALIDGGVCGVDYVSLFPRELVETGEGLIWALFFVMRFLELALAIYSTNAAGTEIHSTIETDLPKLIEHLGRLCASFVRCMVQENGLYHPYWLDVGAVENKNEMSGSHNYGDLSSSKQQQKQKRSSLQSESIESNISVDGSCISFSGVVDRCASAILPSGAVSGDEDTMKKRCQWLHAYCYLPAICCCSLPNVKLSGGDNLEDLFATALNGSHNWDTRAPYIFTDAGHSRLFVSVINSIQLSELMEQLLSEVQFLSQYGIRTMSLLHTCDTASVKLAIRRTSTLSADSVAQQRQRACYTLKQEFCPGASVSCSYGGNTNWYGGVNLPYNYLILEALHRWSTVLDKKFDLIEHPSYTGRYRRLKDIVQELAARNVALFLPNASGIIPSTGSDGKSGLLFYETFDGDTGRGHGAAHKCGWSAIIIRILMLMHDIK